MSFHNSKAIYAQMTSNVVEDYHCKLGRFRQLLRAARRKYTLVKLQELTGIKYQAIYLYEKGNVPRNLDKVLNKFKEIEI